MCRRRWWFGVRKRGGQVIEPGDVFRVRSDCACMGTEYLQGDVVRVESIDYEDRSIELRIFFGGIRLGNFELVIGGQFSAADLCVVGEMWKRIGSAQHVVA